MMKTLGRLGALTLTTGLLALIPVSPAAAADAIVGDATPATGDCGGGDAITYLQTGSAAGNHAVPQNGVITSFTVAGASGGFADVAFNLGRVGGTGAVGIVATSASTTPPATDTVIRQSVRIPALMGDVIGLTLSSGPCTRPGGPQDTYVYFDRNPDGTLSGPMTDPDGVRFRLSVAATVETDADSDGFGDTTQDLCPTQATTQAACAGFSRVKKVRITGKAQVGRKVKVSTTKVMSSFTPTPATIKVQWFRGGQKIKGAKKPAYRVTKADVGKKLKVRLRLTGDAASTTYVVKGPKARR